MLVRPPVIRELLNLNPIAQLATRHVQHLLTRFGDYFVETHVYRNKSPVLIGSPIVLELLNLHPVTQLATRHVQYLATRCRKDNVGIYHDNYSFSHSALIMASAAPRLPLDYATALQHR